MLWILLSRNASTSTKSFYHNSWEMKFILSTQEASWAGFFFSPLNVCECFFGQRSYAGFFSYLFALPGYTVYMSVFCRKINQPLSPPHGPRPTPALLRNGPPDKPWNFPRVIFSLSRKMCSTFQSLVIFQVTCMFFVKGILSLLLD